MNRIAIIIFFFISHISSGQLIQSRIAKEQLLDESLNHTLIGTSQNGLLSLSRSKESLHVDIYDKDSLNLLYHEQVRLMEDDQYSLEIEGVYKVNDRFRLVVTGFSLKFNSNQFVVFVYDILENGKISENFEKKVFSNKAKSKVKVSTEIETNANNSLLLIHLSFATLYKDNVDKHVLVYDGTLANVYEFEHLGCLKSSSKEIHSLTYHLGNDNQLYELSQEIIYNKSLKKMQSVLGLKKFGFKSKEALAVQSIALPDGFMLSDNIQWMDQTVGIQLIASYALTSKTDVLGIRGVYIAKFNQDLSVKYQGSRPFSKTTKLKSLSGFENAEKLEVPTLYKIHNCLEDGLGNTYLIYERESVSNGEFYFGSIIVVKINSEGVVEWDTFISKSQFFKDSAGIPAPLFFPIGAFTGMAGVAVAMVFSIRMSKDTRQYLSFQPILKNNELFLIYNDNPENEGRRAGQGRENMVRIKGSVPFAIRVSPSGEVAYQILKELKKESGNQRLAYSLIENNTTFFTLCDSGKMETLQRIVFE